MLKKQTGSMNASQLRIVLICSMALLFAVTAGVFWYFRSGLVDYAKQVQTDNAKAAVSSSDVSKLKYLKQELEDNKIAITRTKKIVADSQFYQYQNQVIDDIATYAKKANLAVAGFTFNSVSPPAAGEATAAQAQPAAPAGLKTVSISVEIKNPVKYESIMRFIHYIEANLTKMQITYVSVSKSDTTSSDVTVNPINIEAYTR